MKKLTLCLSAVALLLAPAVCLSATPDACKDKSKRTECTGAGGKNECIWNQSTGKCKTNCTGDNFLSSTRATAKKAECNGFQACKWDGNKCVHK